MGNFKIIFKEIFIYLAVSRVCCLWAYLPHGVWDLSCQTHIPCIGRWILNPCTTMEALAYGILLWQPEWTKHSHICPPEQSPNLTAQALEPHVAPQPTYHLRLPVRFFMLQPNEKAPALCFLHFLQPSPHLSLLKSDSSSTWDVLLAPKAQESKT